MPPQTTIDQLPGPKGVPVLGNILDIDRENPIEGFVEMARQYGPIYKLTTPQGVRLVVTGPDLVDELCDDSRFDKSVGAALGTIQNSVAGGGLFTSNTNDPMWHRAHNILMAPFSQQAMRNYMPRMLDVADQLMAKWARLNPGDDIDVARDMTAATLDTIALCGFDYRFNTLHRETQHPFVEAMVRSLLTAQARARRLPIQNRMQIKEMRQSRDDQEYMRTMVQGLIDQRRAQGDAADNSDLLGLMLTGVDPQSGEGLPDANIVAQCVTFLVAGHETTSGLLTFALYYLVKNPAILEQARAEVDTVYGNSSWPTYEQVHSLKYVLQVLEETLRLWPTAPLFTRAPLEDTVIGDTYAIPAGTPITILTPGLQRNKGVWGEDAEDFNPEHMSEERKATTPPNAYKPFGTGMRACIGRQFALQEASLILGMILQRFDLDDYSDYQLKTKTTLTVKPDGFHMRVRPRAGLALDGASAPSTTTVKPDGPAQSLLSTLAPTDRHGTPLRVLFGSNLGTAEGIATRLAREGVERGFDVTLGTLDDHVDDLPTDGAVLIVSSSYNGTPPENAVAFTRWISDTSTPADACAGVRYAVFGCGDTDWAATYQKVPTLIDEGLQAHGASRIHARGEGNVGGDFDGQYRDWHNDLWDGIVETLGLPKRVAAPVSSGPRLNVAMVNRQQSNPVVASYEADAMIVLANRQLERTDPDGPLARSVRHVELTLPAGASYSTGDHLGVLPRNNIDTIRRVMRHFTLDAGTWITIIPNSGSHTHLPTEEPAPLLAILGACVELQDVASREDIETLASYTDDPEQKASLQALVGDDDTSQALYRSVIAKPGRSVLDLLEQYPGCAVPFEVYLDMLPPLRPRYYSISSSPLVDPSVATIATAVVRSPARDRDGIFQGVSSSYLEAMGAGSTVFAFLRQPTIPFHPPEDPTVPMIMVGAGTGLAPFRGFLQERAALKAQGKDIGPSLVFFGAREPRDSIYEDDLVEFEQRGVTRLRKVYSSQPVDGRKYVQHELAFRQDEVWDLISAGSAIFVCGNANTMAPGVRAALVDVYRAKTGESAEEAQAWLADMRVRSRFVEDIWGGGA